VIPYASVTGTKRNLAALKSAGWRLLVSRTGAWNTYGFSYCLDNGRWTDFQEGLRDGLGKSYPFDAERERRFEQMVDQLGADCDFVVIPDTVGDRDDTMRLLAEWLPRLRGRAPLLLIAVQDGMTPDDVRHLVRPDVGIFLGGSTEYKIEKMQVWGNFCAAVGCYLHIGRVNTGRRIKMAAAANANSIDGTSATKYAKTLPLLDNHRRQPDMFAPEKRQNTPAL